MSMTTTLLHETLTILHSGKRPEKRLNELHKHYLDLGPGQQAEAWLDRAFAPYSAIG
jgi:hypothetical protein